MRALSRLRDGLVGAWCPSVSGWGGNVLRDLSGQGNHGQLVNMDPATDWVVSGGKQALDFDGVDDYVAVKSSALIATEQNLSIVAWVIRTAATANDAIYSERSDPSICKLELQSNRVQFTYRNTSSNLLQVITPAGLEAPLNGLVFCAGVISDTLTVYLDNRSEASSSISFPKTLSASCISRICGDAQDGGANFPGSVVDLRIYKRNLSKQEVMALYNGGPGFGLRPERTRRLVQGQTFTAARLRRQSLIGSGVY